MIYMIRAGDDGPVKIGFTNDVTRRVTKMQTDHYQRLVMMRVFDGGPREEALLHGRFAELRLVGEWFTFSDDMLGDVGLVEIALPKPTKRVIPDGPRAKLVSWAADICRHPFGCRCTPATNVKRRRLVAA